MHLDIDSYVDLIREIRRCRDEYVYNTGKEPNIIKMSRKTFDKHRIELVKEQVVWVYYDEFANAIKHRIYGMDLIFDDDMKGVEVCDV